MSKMLQAFGAVFLIAGVALAVMIFAAPGQMQVLALTPEVAAIFLVGGPLMIGIGSLLEALVGDTTGTRVVATERTAAPEPAAMKPVSWNKPSESEPVKAAAAAGAAVVAGAVAKIDPAKASPGVVDTINALEQAKSDIAMALGIEQPAKEKEKEKPAFSIVPPAEVKIEKPVAVSAPVAPVPPSATVTPAAAASEEEADDPDLYVVEEKVIRGRPARVLSDGTVEAETDEGWMRFENLEHLDEYLEAMAP